MLKNIAKQLPECKSVKKLVTIKDIDIQSEEEEFEGKHYPRSLKQISSNKNIPLAPRQGKENDKLIEHMKVSHNIYSNPCSHPTAM